MKVSYATAIGIALAAALVIVLIMPAPASAGNQRDHRGQARAHAASQLGCGAFKHCSKLGVIVRDHRNGAQPGGK